MPRRASFKYHIDRRRSKKREEQDGQEEAYIFGDDDNENGDGDGDGEDEEEYQPSASRDDDDDDDDDEEEVDSSDDGALVQAVLAKKTRSSSLTPPEGSASPRQPDDDEKKSEEDGDDGENANTMGGGGEDDKREDEEDDDEEEWPEHQDDSDDEDFVPSNPNAATATATATASSKSHKSTTKGRKTPASKPRSRPRKSRVTEEDDNNNGYDSDDDFLLVDDEESSSVDKLAKPKPKPKPKPRGRPGGRLARRSRNDEDDSHIANDEGDDDDHSSEEDEVVSSSKPRRGQPRKTTTSPTRKKKRKQDMEDFVVDEDEELEVYVEESKATNRGGRRSAPKRRRRQLVPDSEDKVKFNNDDDDDDDDDVDDAEIIATTTISKQKRSVRKEKEKKSAPKGRQRRTANSSDEDESMEEDSEFDQDDEKVITTTTSRQRTSRATPKNSRRTSRSRTKPQSSDEESSLPAAPSRSRGRRRSTRGKTASYQEVESDVDRSSENGSKEEDETGEAPSSRRRPARFSAAQATQKLEKLARDNDEDADDGDSDVTLDASPSKTNSRLSSDEEFLADSASEHSDEKAVFDDSDEESENSQATALSPSNAVDIDDEHIGSADEDDEDDSSHDGDHDGDRNITLNELSLTPQPAAKGVPRIPGSSTGQLDEIQPKVRSRPRGHQHAYSEDDGNDDSSQDCDVQPSHPKMPICPSVEDAITNEPLPKKHVCFVSPDGQARQCFALETLRQITLKSSHLPFRIDLDGTTQDTFLQPPHFRTAMSDDMLDQIASRFGREALNLHGDFYKRQRLGRNAVADLSFLENDEDVFGSASQVVDFGEAFVERVQKYMTSQMGARDVYACPLCYSELHRRIVRLEQTKPRGRPADEDHSGGGDEESDDDDAFLQLPADSEHDPMLVLGWLDNDKFEAASLFCFTKVANLKKHLRGDHRVETTGIQGNDLYQRYRVRAQDGLLQRWLHNRWRRIDAPNFQGAMQTYWFSGNNQSFVYLLSLVERARYFVGLLQDGDEEEDTHRNEAERFVQVGQTFFESIQDRALLEWAQISSPFTKSAAKEDLRDFLADDDGEEDETPHFLVHRQVLNKYDADSDPNDLVNKIQRKYAENSDEESPEVYGSNDEDENNERASSVGSDLNHSGLYSEEEEEKDDWVNSIRSKRRSSTQGSPANDSTVSTVSTLKAPDATPVGKKLTRRKPTTPSNGSVVVSEPTPVSKRRSIAVDSDDGDF